MPNPLTSHRTTPRAAVAACGLLLCLGAGIARAEDAPGRARITDAAPPPPIRQTAAEFPLQPQPDATFTGTTQAHGPRPVRTQPHAPHPVRTQPHAPHPVRTQPHAPHPVRTQAHGPRPVGTHPADDCENCRAGVVSETIAAGPPGRPGRNPLVRFWRKVLHKDGGHNLHHRHHEAAGESFMRQRARQWRCKFGYFLPTGCCGAGCPPWGAYHVAYARNPYYFDRRDTRVYAAQGYGAPMAVPLAPNVAYQYNYGWGIPSSRITPISTRPR